MTPTPWHLRWVPVTLVLLLMAGLGAVLVPGFRHQLDLSVRRQPVSYVELYFAQSTTAGAQAACTRTRSSVKVRFVVKSHLERRQPVAYRVSVDPSTRGERARRKSGAATVSPDQAVTVARTFSLPRREGYLLSVRLPALGQHLRVRCPGGRS